MKVLIFKNRSRFIILLLCLCVGLIFGFSANAFARVNHKPVVFDVKVNQDYKPYIDGHSFDVSAKVSDDDGSDDLKLSTCKYTLDGSNWFDAVTYWTFSGYKCAAYNLSASDGTLLNINFSIKDKAGNSSEGTAIARTADKQYPSTTINSENYFGPNSKLITGTSNDNVSGIKKVKIHIFKTSLALFGQWNGSGWQIIPAELNVNGTINWKYDGILSDRFINGASYSVIPEVEDNVGHEKIGKTKIFIWDNIAPLTLYGINGTTGLNDYYISDVNINFSASDDGSGITNTFYNLDNTGYQPGNAVTINQDGKHDICYYSVDSAGNSESQKCESFKIDKTAPVITLSGDNPYTVEYGNGFEDPGASTSDNITDSEKMELTTESNLDTNILGSYQITYDTQDQAGNKANQVVRRVYIVDTQKPIIKVKGSNVIITAGDSYFDQGATAIDNYDGLISEAIVANNNVNSGVAGIYTIIYDVTDSSGNKAENKTRIVTVRPRVAVVATQAIPQLTVVLGTNTDYTQQNVEDDALPTPTPTSSLTQNTEPLKLQSEQNLTEVKGTSDSNRNIFYNLWWVWLIAIIAMFGLIWLIFAAAQKSQSD